MASGPKKRGVYADPATVAPGNLQDKVADFGYESDALADMIVEAWTNTTFRNGLIAGSNYPQRSSNAQAALAARGIYLGEPIVITEREYENGFHLLGAGLTTDGIVFVLPRRERATNTAGTPLLETAKMLMAVTPNGI